MSLFDGVPLTPKDVGEFTGQEKAEAMDKWGREKRCTRCQMIKPLIQGFGLRRMGKDGPIRPQPQCKACR